MDGPQFDQIGRRLSQKLPRRLLGVPLVAAAVGALGLSPLGRALAPVGATPAPQRRQPRCLKTGRRCTRRSGGKGDPCRRCCSGYAKRRPSGGGRCTCKPSGGQCVGDHECCSQACLSGVCWNCVAAAPDHCGDVCLNFQSDRDNCGQCGNVCGNNQKCLGGACVDLTCGNGGSCLIFVTSSTHTGNLGGLAGADAICQLWAEASAHPGTFKAWLSSTTASPSTRFTRNPGPYRVLGGGKIADDWTQLTSGTLQGPILYTDNGQVVPESASLLTATTTAGHLWQDPLVTTCNDWQVADGAATGGGEGQATNSRWTQSFAGRRCDQPFQLICVQQA